MSQLLSATAMRQMRRESKYSGLTYFEYTPRRTDLDLECWIEYEPAERGSWRDGQQQEPDYPESATLCLVEINGTDILEILSESTVQEIETSFLEQEVEA